MNKYRMAALSVLAASFCALAGRVAAETQSFDFDRTGADAAAVFASVKKQAKAEPSVVAAASAASIRHTRECAEFKFGPEHAGHSKVVPIESKEFVERCVRDRDGDENCSEVLNRTYRENVSIHIAERKPLFPWETEKFEVCLEGRYLDARAVSAAYEYTFAERNRDGYFIVTAGNKVPMLPDPAGLTIGLANSADAIVMNVGDRWAAHYAGEQLAIRVRLRKHRSILPDQTLLSKEFVFATAAAHRIDFGAYAAELDPKLEAGEKYYVEWGFKRIGRVSKPDLIDRGSTGKIKFSPTSAQIASR